MSDRRGAFSAMRWISAAPQSRLWSARRDGFAHSARQRLGRSSVVSRNYNKFWPPTCRGVLNPLVSTTAFFVCCGMRRRFLICADVTLRRFDIPRRERTMWHVEHSTGEFWLCRNRVAVAAQSQSSMVERLPTRQSRATISGAAQRGRSRTRWLWRRSINSEGGVGSRSYCHGMRHSR